MVLYRQAGSLWCRADGAFDVDGRTCASRAPLTLQSSVLGEGFSFSLEPVGESVGLANELSMKVRSQRPRFDATRSASMERVKTSRPVKLGPCRSWTTHECDG